MLNTDSMFENSNISLTSNINISMIENCKCMYKNCDLLVRGLSTQKIQLIEYKYYDLNENTYLEDIKKIFI